MGKNFVFISPTFPKTYYQFPKAWKELGGTSLCIGEDSWESLSQEMKDSMTLKSDDEDSSMSQYKDMFMDTVIEQMSDTIVEKSGENITQQLYEQMKRNYNIS